MTTLNQKALEEAFKQFGSGEFYRGAKLKEYLAYAIQAYLQSVAEQQEECKHDWDELCAAEKCNKCGVIIY